MIANFELASKFAVEALPTVVLTTPEGYVIGCVYGNQMFEPITDATQEVKIIENKVLKDLSAYNKNAKAIVSLRKKLAKTEGFDRLAIIDKMIGELDSSYRYLLRDLVAEIPELDPENKTGLNTKYKMNFAYEEALAEYSQGNAQRAIEIFVEVAQTEGIPAIDAQEAYQTAAYLAANIGASDEMVVAYLEKAIEAMPKSDAVPGIQATIDMIKNLAETPSTDEVSE